MVNTMIIDDLPNTILYEPNSNFITWLAVSYAARQSKDMNGRQLAANLKENFRGWWCHQMEIFSVLLAHCTGYSPVTLTKPSDAELWWCLLYMLLNKLLSKQSRRWWFETPSRPLWRIRVRLGALHAAILIGIWCCIKHHKMSNS